MWFQERKKWGRERCTLKIKEDGGCGDGEMAG